MEFRGTVDIGRVSPGRGDSSEGFGYIAAGIVAGKILAKLSDHAEAVGAGAGGQGGKALLVAVGDLSGNAGFAQPLRKQKAVEVFQQPGLTLIIGAGEAAQMDEVLDLTGQTAVKLSGLMVTPPVAILGPLASGP